MKAFLSENNIVFKTFKLINGLVFDRRYLVKMLSFAAFSYILYLYLEMFFDLWVLLKSLFNALV